MRRFLVLLSVICCLLVFAGAAWSLTINSGAIEVGVNDFLLASGKVNSGESDELDWVKSILGISGITLEAKNDDNMTWYLTNIEGTYAIDFETTNPEYFLVKTGNLQVTDHDHFLFRNDPELGWGVISLISDLGLSITDIYNISKISHIDEFSAQVPEPSTLLLLGAGLIGLGVLGRKKFRTKS